ncbi:hypothetical protein, partial [Amycolatopsis japonica]
VVVVSCGVDNPAAGGLLDEVRMLALDDGYRGELSGPVGRARVWEDGRIEEIQATPEELTAKPDGGVGEHDGVRYVDLTTPGQRETVAASGFVLPDDADRAVWSEALREAIADEAVSAERARREAEKLVRGGPSVLARVDEDELQFLYEGLASEAALDLGVAAERAMKKWRGRIMRAAGRVDEAEKTPGTAARAGQASAEAEELARALPSAAEGADNEARQLLHQGLVSILTAAILNGADQRSAWQDPEVAEFRADLDALRGLKEPHYRATETQILRPVRSAAAGQAESGTEVFADDPGDEALTTWMKTIPGVIDRIAVQEKESPDGWVGESLSAAVAEFESRLNRDTRHGESSRAEAAALLGERPPPRMGYGPSALEQQRLWQAMTGSVAWALSRGADAESLAADLRAGFERLCDFDESGGPALPAAADGARRGAGTGLGLDEGDFHRM